MTGPPTTPGVCSAHAFWVRSQEEFWAGLHKFLMGEINRGRWTTVYEKKRHRLARTFNRALGVPEADYRPGEFPRQDVVIFDNLASHLSPSVSETIERAGASVSPLPPYRPDFNPIEEMFSKFKEFLHRVEARAKEHLYDAIGEGLREVTPEDIFGRFRHAGACVTQA